MSILVVLGWVYSVMEKGHVVIEYTKGNANEKLSNKSAIGHWQGK
jgi:hypothetical protein